jgi:hypothetical protein
MKNWFVVSFIVLLTGSAMSQNTMTEDPLLKFHHFYEIGLGFTESRVNTNEVSFDTPNGHYDFVKNNNLPNLDASFNFGWLFKNKKDNEIWLLKTGVNILTRNADVYDSGMNRLPIKNNFYRAFDFNVGLYASVPLAERLDIADNVDARGESVFGNYVKFGTLAEVAFSSLNDKGHGHKFGLRASTDFSGVMKLKDTKTGLYPTYITLGLFYNLSNRYY